MRRILPISPGDGRPLGPWLAAMGGTCILREPGRGVGQWAVGHIVHERCADAPIAGSGLHLRAGSAVPAWDGLLGVSTHSLDEALAAQAAGADYVLLSPAFHPTSKPLDARPTLGIDALVAVQRALTIPVFALGGVTPERARRLVDAGVHGVAVLGILAASPERIREYPC